MREKYLIEEKDRPRHELLLVILLNRHRRTPIGRIEEKPKMRLVWWSWCSTATSSEMQHPNTRAPHIYMGTVLDVVVVLDRLGGTIEAGRGGWLGEVTMVVTHTE